MFCIEEFVELGSIEIGSINTTEAVARRCSAKNIVLKISQSPQENTCAIVSFLIKLQAEPYLKRGSDTDVFL